MNTEPKTIALCEPSISENEKDWIISCIESGYVSSAGPMIKHFEDKFAELVDAKYAIATASGTAAIHAALHATGIKGGDTVIVPDLTFIASINPVFYCGANPAIVDVDRDTWCLNPKLLDIACGNLLKAGKKPSAVIPVHIYGCSCDMDAIKEIAKKYNLHIIEDATEALGSRFDGKHVGTIGEIGCFSFNGNKMMTTGCGGMVTTNSQATAERVRHLVNQAKNDNQTYLHNEMGFNYRMSSLAAALGMGQIERISEIFEKKRLIAKRYSTAFREFNSVKCHPEPEKTHNSFWLYSIIMKSKKKRDELMETLKNKGICTREFFTPLHCQPYIKTMLPKSHPQRIHTFLEGNSSYLSYCGINLPSSFGLSEEEQNIVIQESSRLLSHEHSEEQNTFGKETLTQKKAS